MGRSVLTHGEKGIQIDPSCHPPGKGKALSVGDQKGYRGS